MFARARRIAAAVGLSAVTYLFGEVTRRRSVPAQVKAEHRARARRRRRTGAPPGHRCPECGGIGLEYLFGAIDRCGACAGSGEVPAEAALDAALEHLEQAPTWDDPTADPLADMRAYGAASRARYELGLDLPTPPIFTTTERAMLRARGIDPDTGAALHEADLEHLDGLD